jgi:hypothetical protein
MTAQPELLDSLSPTPLESGINLLGLLHVVLVVLVMVQVFRGRLAVPHGVFGVAVLLLVPVAGPLLVLTWKTRMERRQDHDQRAAV